MIQRFLCQSVDPTCQPAGKTKRLNRIRCIVRGLALVILMTGAVAADLPIRGLLGATSDIAGHGVNHAGHVPECVLNAPEASGGKGGGLCVHTLLERRGASAGFTTSLRRTSSTVSRRAKRRWVPSLTATTAGRGNRL